MPEPAIGIPFAYRRPLQTLLGLSSDAFEKVIAALSDAPADSTTDAALKGILEVTPKESSAEIPVLLSFAVSARALLRDLPMNATQLSQAVARSYADAETDVDVAMLSERIQRLITSRFVALREKMGRLSRVGNARVSDIQIVTDSRPVFETFDDPREPDPGEIVGVIVRNVLQLDVLRPDGSEATETFSVDRDDLELLQALIVRALNKTNRLTSLFEKAGIIDLTERE